ncbi:efflux RND transporter periplasmic adaptor subunit [Jiella sonneratiae]|uniref:Efflux RND transporter periplasmic adaptor subunit n=1 Tax=Jiella sonneratiae TaxID=2816856 RepID=A0ABS3J0A4_9HYPH|nr:efflux RND transporter periplasmic adaptor subunit [Jiella sonneratiae]MBO0903109.1 efflux RND transporter periplasmic adaptor subunit [Jiella sonneratiae]
MIAGRLVALVAAALFLSGCSQSEEDEGAPPPRPVLTTTLAETDPQVLGYSGTVEPRFETQLAFRVLGRIVSRSADVGDIVKAGEPVAEIDAETLNADLRSAEAAVDSAEVQARNARAAFARTERLFSEKTVAQSAVDTARQTQSSAEADLVSAKAQLAKAEDALSYAVLKAPFDGVITQRQADVGQVVAAGTAVMTLARTDQREAVIDVPLEESRDVSVGTPFKVVLQVAPATGTDGKVREIAPRADTVTRTIRIRITLEDPPAAFRLGSLITAIPAGRMGRPTILLPQTAILDEDGKTRVWVVDRKAGTVHKREVAVEKDGSRTILVSGAEPGEVIVTAGVHSLKEGQKVSLSEGLSL